jgi:hypothetical protein
MSIETIWITADQCTPQHPVLRTADPTTTIVLMIESIAHARERPSHKRKLVLLFAAMRGFADDLRAAGWTVDYYAECASFESALAAHVARYRPARFAMMSQSDYGVNARLTALVAHHGLPVEIAPHVNFISTAADFNAVFPPGRTRVTMETFYRRMRVKTGLLMDGDRPAGGAWNFDRENRRPPKAGMTFPPEPAVPKRPHVVAAIALVQRQFADHPGTIGDFDIPTTRADALAYAEDFFTHRLPGFGAYEDAMLHGEVRMYHSRLSALINIGLLHPLELCERAEAAYRAGVLSGRQHVDGVRRRGATRDVGAWLGAPYPAADGAGKLRPSRRVRAPSNDRLVLGHVRRRLRLGDGAQRRRDDAVCRRRGRRHEALCRVGELHQADVRLLSRMCLRSEADDRRACVSLQRAVLGLHRSQPVHVCRESAHGTSHSLLARSRRSLANRRSRTSACTARLRARWFLAVA